MYLNAEYKYEKIIRWFETQFNLGRVSPHSQMPSIRTIASSFNLSISTVQRAIKEMRSKGLIYSNGSKCFYFSENMSERDENQGFQDSLLSRTMKLYLLSQRSEMAAFNLSYPGRSLDAGPFLQKCIRNIGKLEPRKLTLPPPIAGLNELRQRLVGVMFDRGINMHTDDIVVTQGDTTSLEAILGSVCDKGDVILLENPTHHAVLNAVKRLELEIHSIETHINNGINLEYLERAMRNKAVKVLYLNPTLQVPLSQIMPLLKRRKIIRMAEHYGVVIVEDDAFADMVPAEKRPPALASLAQSKDSVIYLGSFNRTVASSLSIGWCANGKYTAAITRKLIERSYFVSMLNQQLAREFLRKGFSHDHNILIQQKIARNNQIFQDIVVKFFPKSTRVIGEQYGFSKLIELPFQLSARDFKILENKNIMICDIGAFYKDAYPHNLIRICLSELIDTKIKAYFQNMGKELSYLQRQAS